MDRVKIRNIYCPSECTVYSILMSAHPLKYSWGPHPIRPFPSSQIPQLLAERNNDYKKNTFNCRTNNS